MAKVLSGRTLAQDILARVRTEAAECLPRPTLVIISTSDRHDSAIYIERKRKALESVAFRCIVERARGVNEAASLIRGGNHEAGIHGVLLQLPLGDATANERRLLDLIAPEKDVDGLTTTNIGRLVTNQPGPRPCTPLAIMELLRHYKVETAAKHAVILGRSHVVGLPVATMLTQADATVTTCHSRTANVAALTRQADIVVAAVGKCRLVQADWIKPSSTVIDVGINRLDGKLCGDVDYEGVAHIASAISPVPGGVGPLTVAMLVRNLWHMFAKRQHS